MQRTMLELRSNRRVMGVASVIGDELINPEGEELGMIHELLIDPEIGVVAFAVVSLHGLPGLDSKLFVVPWQTLQARPDEHKFVLDIEKVHLIEALVSEEDGWQWASHGEGSLGFKRQFN